MNKRVGMKKVNGFTLVELLIATAVFSVVMLISTYAFMRISNYYLRAITVARMQETVRNVTSDITDQIKLSTGEIAINNAAPISWGVVYKDHTVQCFGNKRYVYKVNTKENGTGSAIFSQNITPGNCLENDFTNKTVLIPKGARLLVFDVKDSGIDPETGKKHLYNTKISVMYAPDDGEDPAGSDVVDTTAGDTAYDKWVCKSGVSGGEYCAIVSVSSSILRRL